MLNMLRRLIGEDIALEWRPGGDVPPILMAPSQIDQILANLVVNSRDAIDGAGRIIIETGSVTVTADDCGGYMGMHPGDFVQLRVIDTGCGMDATTLQNIFEPYFTTKEQGKGTGLGLSTVYGIVKQNDAFIRVESAKGEGTITEIRFPVTGAPRPTHVTNLPTAPTAEGETILLVEDDQAMLRMTEAMLTRMGFRVLSTNRPTEAVALAQQSGVEVRLIITDVVMPEMNGRQLVKALETALPDIEHLFMSGYTADVLAPHVVLDEHINFIPKPFTRAELARKIQQVLHGA